jgi:serine/threonine protein kinase
MQLVRDSITLGEWLFNRDVTDLTVNEPLNMKILIQVLQGLRHIHKHGYVHRDIKPDNVFVRKDGRALIGDFGLAKDLNENSAVEAATVFNTIINSASNKAITTNNNNNNNNNNSVTSSEKVVGGGLDKPVPLRQNETTRSYGSRSVGNVSVVANAANAMFDADMVKSPLGLTTMNPNLTTGLGTYFYASPEQRQEMTGGSVYDYRSDMYSLGVLIFEMWCPFPTDAIRENALLQLTTTYKLPTSFGKKFYEIATWVARLCAKDMNLRPSCDDLLASPWVILLLVVFSYFNAIYLFYRHK